MARRIVISTKRRGLLGLLTLAMNAVLTLVLLVPLISATLLLGVLIYILLTTFGILTYCVGAVITDGSSETERIC
jgi:hypothetical protein